MIKETQRYQPTSKDMAEPKFWKRNPMGVEMTYWLPKYGKEFGCLNSYTSKTLDGYHFWEPKGQERLRSSKDV